MKPIFLRFAGLHSYIDEQRVDFTFLLGAGVFGIFGPTGSGKSTVLDAMTLALYGSVERAAHNTQGIINQYCKQASVAFTFELEDTAGVRRFRVERTFRKGKAFESVEALQARFVELAIGIPGKEDILHVLADKPGAVIAKVVEELGLTLADFTRAVVLPQGRFAEFLMLKGNDRRSMLQRLFGLELFGDRLMQQVKQESQATEQALATVKAARLELGDASASALQVAKEKVATNILARDLAAAKALSVEKEY
jgi:exonuclease SbcC